MRSCLKNKGRKKEKMKGKTRWKRRDRKAGRIERIGGRKGKEGEWRGREEKRGKTKNWGWKMKFGIMFLLLNHSQCRDSLQSTICPLLINLLRLNGQAHIMSCLLIPSARCQEAHCLNCSQRVCESMTPYLLLQTQAGSSCRRIDVWLPKSDHSASLIALL